MIDKPMVSGYYYYCHELFFKLQGGDMDAMGWWNSLTAKDLAEAVWELCSIAITIAIAVAIVAYVRAYDDRPTRPGNYRHRH